MKYDALLKARKDTLDEFLCDEEYDTAEKAIDAFLDHLEEHIGNADEIKITKTGSLEIKSDAYSEG